MDSEKTTQDNGYYATDQCAICRNILGDLCLECQAEGRSDNACKVAIGSCGHTFHYHCITRWLESGRTMCPLDNIAWDCKSVESND